MTLRQLLSECLEEARSEAGMDPLKYPSQVQLFSLLWSMFVVLIFITYEM